MDIKLPESLYISIDSNRMGQVISNILDNAVKFTAPGGHIYIDALQCNEGAIISLKKCKPLMNGSSLQCNEGAIIRVKDTGTGISPAELPMIWDRLYRGDQSSTKRARARTEPG